ncbi:MAG: acetylxylan esterase [Verrucomicrobiae bacterium]|nr:acetylxylan esterase [Verrucomicrobiae bacterium]
MIPLFVMIMTNKHKTRPDTFSRWLLFIMLASLTLSIPATAQEAEGDTFPPPGSTGNAANVPHIGGRDPGGNPVRLARKTGHVSNYDESKVKPYVLPNPLKMADGRVVDSATRWSDERRNEILSFYETQIYGRVPNNTPNIQWQAQPNGEDGEKRIEGRIGDQPDGPKIGLTLHLPNEVEGPVPVLLNLSFFSSEAAQARFLQRSTRNNDRPRFDQRAAVLQHGWAFAQIGYGDIQPDRADHWREGVIGQTLSENQERPAADEWGTISAWAWGASRVIDYLETVEAIDRKRIALTGASRLGKTSLWAAAKDSRIAAVLSVVPGEMGASLIRRDWGETLDDMAQNFHWQFAGNLQNWVGKWEALPIDQHMLISLIAPRAVYVNGGLSDQWSDPKGEFLAMVAAGPVYRLLGAGDLGTDKLPELDQPIISKSLAFHYHSKGHHSVPEDWQLFLEFADKHFAATEKSKGASKE